jgi:transcriptional regulator NrdR family protein
MSERTGNYLTCPACGGDLTKTTDSRPRTLEGIAVIGRRRVCEKCGERHTTYEMPADQFVAMRKAIAKAMVLRLIDGEM